MTKIRLNVDVIRSFKVSKVFRDTTHKITSMDFSDDGKLLVCCCSEDDMINVYDLDTGTMRKPTYSRKYGVELIRFFHNNHMAIHTSTKIDDSIRYLSLHDNKYDRYFQGHTKKVTGLSVSPTSDQFISASQDNTMRIWDVRTPSCVGMMQTQGGKPVVGYDPEGLLFAVGTNSEMIRMYDLRSYDQGPFVTLKHHRETECDWTGLKFGCDGRSIMISTNGSVIRTYDAFMGNPLHTFTGYVNNKGVPIEASYSPDAKYIFCGSTDGVIHVWNAESGCKVGVLTGGHPFAVTLVRFNPKYMMLASACHNMAFWVPDLQVTEDAVEEPPSQASQGE